MQSTLPDHTSSLRPLYKQPPYLLFVLLPHFVVVQPIFVILDKRFTYRTASGLAFFAILRTRRFWLDFSHFNSPLIHLSFYGFTLLKSCSKSLKTDYRVAGYGILATHQKEVLSVLAGTVNRRYSDFSSRSVFVVKDL